MIDDHLGILILPRSSWRHLARTLSARDSEVFGASQAQYAKVGLKTKQDKKVRRQHEFTAWGATTEGLRGLTAPPPPGISCSS